MPLCPTRRLAFVHIPKTGGASVLRALQSDGSELQFTGLGLWDDLRNRADATRLLAALREVYPLNSLKYFPQIHLPARLLREIVTSELWDEYFSFAIVRNPWDLVVSTYHFWREFLQEDGPNAALEPDVAELIHRCDDFSQFVRLYPLQFRCDMTAMLVDADGHLLVDFVGRFETIERDFRTISERAGLNGTVLPHVNRTEHLPYRKYYTTETRDLIASHFARDIERFGYEF